MNSNDLRDEDRAIFSLLEVLHWIAFGYADPPEDESSIAAWEEAEEKLVSALRGLPGADRGLIAIGLKFGRGDPQEIPQEFWTLPTESEKEGLLPPPARSLAFRPLGNCVDVVHDGRPESVWQEIRFYRRDVMRLWPSPLRGAAALHEAAAPPSKSLQGMDPFERRHWNQLQALLWLCTRSQQAVRVAMASDSDDDIGRIGEVILIHDFALPFPGTSDPFAAAEQILIDALSEGRIRAWGVGNGEGDHKEIPASHWNGLRFYWAKPVVGLVQDLPPAVRCSPRYAGPRDRDRTGATYWTDVHLSRADMLAIWPPIGDQEGVMKARYWTLWQTLVWVCTRSRSDVQDATHQAPSPFWLSCAPALEQVLHGRYSEYLDGKEVEGAVVAAIRSGDLPALARGNGDGDRVKIPAEERFGLVLSYEGRSVILRHAQGHSAPFWSDVVCEREAVLAIWPDLLARPDGNSVEAGAQGQRVEMTRWFDEYVQGQQRAGHIPARDHAEKAMRVRFGKGIRAHFRAIWNSRAPETWRRTGPKGLHRKGAIQPSSNRGRRI